MKHSTLFLEQRKELEHAYCHALPQAGVHLLQTEGSRMVMALCQSSYNQGVYGLVTNLGSLVVRTIFFPVEEAAFRAFSKPPSKLHALY